jgi:outer membrane protein OmpA-like peptidoglycan-associated protein
MGMNDSTIGREPPTIRRLGLIVLVTVVVLAATACAGVTPQPPGGGVPDIMILVSGTATEPRPAMLAGPASVVRAAAEDREVTDGANGRGRAARVVAAAGTYTATFPLTPRRPDGSVEHGLNRDTLVAGNVGRVGAAVADVRATDAGLDLVRAIDDVTRGAQPGTLIVISHGIATKGGFDLRQVGWEADPRSVADQLRDRDLLPDLTGWRVIFSGLGSTGGAQPPLPRPARLKLIAYWTAICAAAGGTCEFDDTPMEPAEPASGEAMPTVAVPGVESVTGPHGELTYTVTDQLLGFPGDSAELAPAAVDYLKGIAAQIRIRTRDNPRATVTVTGYCADPPGSTTEGMKRLSRARADNVARVLREGGVTNPIEAIGGGVAPGGSATRNGQFDDARGAQMRRVEITVNSTT